MKTGTVHFDFGDTAAALDYVNSGRVKGKVVVTMP